MSVRVAINGFGRTGRAMFRAAHEREAEIEWVAINDVADPEMLAHLLRHDTVYGPFPGVVEATEGALIVDGRRIEAPSISDPAALPWASSASMSWSSRPGGSAHVPMPRSISKPVRAR